MKKHTQGFINRRLQLKKISIVSLSAQHAYWVKGGDDTLTTILQPAPTVPSPAPQPVPQPKPEPTTTKTENSLAGGNDCTVMLTK